MRAALVRKIATGVLLLDVLVVGAAAVKVSNVVTRTTTAEPSALTAPGSTLGVNPVSPAALLPGAPPLVASLPPASLSATAAAIADALAQLGSSAGTETPRSDGSAPTVTPTPDAEGGPGRGQVPPCPIKLSDPSFQASVSPILTTLTTNLGVLLTGGPEVETQLAAVLAPYTQGLTRQELDGCIVELQNALVAASAPGTPALDLPSLGAGGLR